MNHQEIRFRILHTLYQEYYSGKRYTYIPTESIIKASGVDNINKEVVLGDIVYLKNSGYVEGLMEMGTSYPVQLSITNYGIDAVERIVEDSLETLTNADSTEIRSKVKEISNESDPNTKAKKLWEYAKDHPDLITGTIEKVMKVVFGIG